jgi:hypothetical protein
MVNYLSIISLHIILELAKVYGILMQKLIQIYLSRRGNSFDHAHIYQDPRNHKSKCDLPVECFWAVDVPRNDEGSSIPEVLCWSACLKCKYSEINTEHLSWNHSNW